MAWRLHRQWGPKDRHRPSPGKSLLSVCRHSLSSHSQQQCVSFWRRKKRPLGSIEICIPTPGNSFFPVQVDVVSADSPLLLGLDLLDDCRIYFSNVKNLLCFPDINWEIPISRKLGHAYVEWKTLDSILFTRSELLRLHRGFQHPHQDKLLNLLKRARPADLDPQTRSILREISESCDTFQRLGPRPIRFKATLPSVDDIIFGEELSIDLMFIDSEAILHVVDSATRFSSATFLKYYEQSVEGIWLAFIEAWRTIYTRYPNRLRTDAGSVFTSPRWKDLTDMSGIELRISGVEAHNSFGIGERLHALLRCIYRKIKNDFPQISPDILLELTVKAMNDTNGENGLVPSLLVFGIIPRFPIISSHLPTHRQRMKVLSEAPMEMNAFISERRISRILHRNIAQATDHIYQVGEEVLVYREGPDQWMGPFLVSKVQDKRVSVFDQNRIERTFNVQQVKPYRRTTPSSDMLDSSEFLNEMLSPFLSGTSSTPLPCQTLMTEVIKPSDPRAEKFTEAKKKEIQGLIDRGTWKM